MTPFETSFNRTSAWILTGPGIEFEQGPIWAPIERSLLADPMAESLKCGDTILTRGEVHASICRFPPIIAQLDRVGVHVARSIASVVATLAIWRADAAYVPLALENPPERLAEMAANCALHLIIADREMAIPGYRVRHTMMVCGTRLIFYAWTGVPSQTRGDPRLCYIAHTSGTTGVAKGAMISHEALLHRLACLQRLIAIGPGDRFLYKTSSVFDVHVWEFALPLVSGCIVSIYPQSDVFNLASVLKIAVADRTTVLGLVPSLLQLAMRSTHFRSGNALRVMFCGGETWRGSLADAFRSALPNTALYNSYGPAETTLAVSNWFASDEERGDAIGLGDPLGNTIFAVVPTGSGNADSDSIDGALWIGGPQVALGYVGDVFAERFVNQVIARQATRFYASGDYVRLNTATGTLHFLGRQDTQVKVNGARIELEEIEAVIGNVPGVEACAAWIDRCAAAQLWAAYTVKPGHHIDERGLRDACHARLPRAAMPAQFRYLASLPLRSSGKIDRAALARLFSSSEERGVNAA